MIPEEYEGAIVQTGIDFMRTVTHAYGAEEGMRLWDTIASTLDPDIKGKMFFALLTGEIDSYLSARVKDIYKEHLRVPGIKVIREVSGLGLKEAKDLHDAMVNGVVVKIKVPPLRRNAAIQELASVAISAM